MNLDKTSNLGQKFAALNILLYRKLLPAIAGFIQVQLFQPSLFIGNVKSDHLYVVWQTNDSNNTRLRVRALHNIVNFKKWIIVTNLTDNNDINNTMFNFSAIFAPHFKHIARSKNW